MTTLRGKSPKDTYGGLLKVEGSGLLTTLQQVEDGFGNPSPLRLSKLEVSINNLIFPTIAGAPGRVLAVAADGVSMEWIVAGGGSTPVPTAKGTIKVSDGTTLIDLGVGANGQVLMADSTKPTGVKWGTVASGGGGGEPTVDSAVYTYTANKSVETLTETIGANTRVSTYAYNQAGAVETITTEYMGVTRTETYTYVNGQVSSMTSTTI